MKISRQLLAICIGTVLSLAGITNAAEKPSALVSGNYLYIEELVIGPGMIPEEAIAEASDWVRAFRKTGEYESVRMYIHNTGPAFGIYILSEPKSWQSIEDGASKAIEDLDFMSRQWNWGGHSDNILSEILVE